MYSVGDKVLFTFIGREQNGVVTENLTGGKFKVKGDNGTKYTIFGKEPVIRNGSKVEKPLGVIIKKL